MVRRLRKDLFRHIDTLSYSELDGIGTPTLVTRMTSDINRVRKNGVNLTLRLLLRTPFIVIGARLWRSISPKLTLLFIGVTIMVSLHHMGHHARDGRLSTTRHRMAWIA